MKTCSVADCNNTSKIRGWCKLHYQHWYRHGDPVLTKHEMHGMRHTPEYAIWCTMKARCNNPNNKAFGYYGGRGIQVCERWMKSFKNFIEDIGQRPSNGHSLDRINNDGDYEPGNVKWSTYHEQRINQRRMLV